jgi:hypothetical protein
MESINLGDGHFLKFSQRRPVPLELKLNQLDSESSLLKHICWGGDVGM